MSEPQATPITDGDLAELVCLEAAVTPEQWRFRKFNDITYEDPVSVEMTLASWEFAVAIRNAAKALLTELASLRKSVDAAREAFLDIDLWVFADDGTLKDGTFIELVAAAVEKIPHLRKLHSEMCAAAESEGMKRMRAEEECERLRAENAKLSSLLASREPVKADLDPDAEMMRMFDERMKQEGFEE